MGFTTPCFIWKDTLELRNKLEKLGYFKHPSCCEESFGYLYVGRNLYCTCPIGYIEEVTNAIDCGDNEKLFLAIAALRDDTDKHQWFVMEEKLSSINYPDSVINKATFIKCCLDKWCYLKNEYCLMDISEHKATIEELIYIFKQEKQ